MAKHDEFGKIAKDCFLSGENVTKVSVQKQILEKYKIKIDHRTLKRWSVIDKWEEDRLSKYFSLNQLETKLKQLQIKLASEEKPSAQLLYAVNITMKTVEETRSKEKQRAENDRIDTDEDEVEELIKMRKILRKKIKENINAGISSKDSLDELQKLDTIIQNTKKLQRETQSEQRVYMFSFDGIDHTQEIIDASN